MKILHLLYESKGDYFGIGGVGVRAYKIYSQLRDRHDITFLCKSYPNAEDKEIEGIKHLFVGSKSQSFTKTLLAYALEASRFVRRYGSHYDVIVEEFSPAIPTLLFLYRERPLILQIQGYTGKNYFEKYGFLKALTLFSLENYIPRFYKNVISVSEPTVKRYRLREDVSLCIIPNGIDKYLLRHPEGSEDYILYLGRIDIHHKGIDILLRAYDYLCREYDVPLILAGDFRDKRPFYQLIDQLNERTRDNIKVLGWVDGNAKIDLLRNSMFVVMPSRYETQGIVALEAMACAKPLVVSDIAELSYVVECGAGWSFESHDPVSLSNVMRRMLLSEDRRLMGRKGRHWVSSLTWESMALRFERFLLDTMKDYNK